MKKGRRFKKDREENKKQRWAMEGGGRWGPPPVGKLENPHTLVAG